MIANRFRSHRALCLTASLLAGSQVWAAERVPFDRDLLQEIRAYCNDVHLRGLFHGDTYACVPGLREAAEGKLCKADVGPFFLPFAAGFGSGPQLRAGAGKELDTVIFRPQDWSSFASRTVDCPDSGEAELKLTGDIFEDLERVLTFWKSERASVPLSVLGPWEACIALQSQPVVAKRTQVHCHAIGSFDLAGEGEEVFFQATSAVRRAALDPSLLPIRRYRGPRLTDDLRVSGADCEGREWKKGMRLSHTGALRCQREGRSAVTFRLATRKGECLASLPELSEPPLAELCTDAPTQ